MGVFFEKYKGILLFMFVYWCISFIMLFKEPSFLYVMLSWNVLLAVLPLFFVIKAEMTMGQRKIGWSIFFGFFGYYSFRTQFIW